MRTPRAVRTPGTGESGQGTVEYLGMISVAVAVVGALVATAVAPAGAAETLAHGYCHAVSRIAGGSCDDGDGGDGGGGDGSGPKTDDDFQPEKCLLSSEDSRTTTVVQILFLKLTSSEQLKVRQWSDGTVTMELVDEAGAGVGGEISAQIGKLGKWGGKAQISGGITFSSGSGGQWVFNAHKSGDRQQDLKDNYADAKKFYDFLKEVHKCNSRPGRSELQMICAHGAQDLKPDDDPELQPDVDITRTSTEASGEVGFGLSYGGDDKKVGKLKDEIADKVRKENPGLTGADLDKKIKDAQGRSIVGQSDDDEAGGDVVSAGIAGSMTKDVTVLRAQSGPDKGKITFVYTFTMSGSAKADVAGHVEGRAEGTYQQQIAVTYDAKKYDEEKEKGDKHHPEKLSITTNEKTGGGAKGHGSEETEVGAGDGITINVEGGAGKTTAKLHSENATVKLSGDDSTAVEDWLRGRGSNPAGGSLPNPEDATRPLGDGATPVEKLLHDKAQVTSLDYNVNTDWWQAGWGIGLGVAAGSVNLGFKLFGMSVEHEESDQVITGDPTYAGAPEPDGSRPWLPFTNCSDVKPVTDDKVDG